MRKILLLFLSFGSWLIASELPPQNQNDQSKVKNDQVQAEGCISQSGGHYILLQSDLSNSYVLEAADSIDLHHYLGQHVKVAGTESHTTPTSSHSIQDSSGGGRPTIVVDSIDTISKRCAH